MHITVLSKALQCLPHFILNKIQYPAPPAQLGPVSRLQCPAPATLVPLYFLKGAAMLQPQGLCAALPASAWNGLQTCALPAPVPSDLLRKHLPGLTLARYAQPRPAPPPQLCPTAPAANPLPSPGSFFPTLRITF